MLISEQSPGVVSEQTPRRSLSRSHTLSLADSAAGTCSMCSGCQGESVQSKNTTWMRVCAPRPSCVEEGETFFQTSWAERKTPCTVWEQLSCLPFVAEVCRARRWASVVTSADSDPQRARQRHCSYTFAEWQAAVCLKTLQNRQIQRLLLCYMQTRAE